AWGHGHRGSRTSMHVHARRSQTRCRHHDLGRAWPVQVRQRTSSRGARTDPAQVSTTHLQVMGVVNVTDDSFSDGGRYLDADRAVEQGLALAAEGASIIDVGGESTRPGAVRLDPRVEIARIAPVVKGLAAQGITVSVDTMHAGVARAALESGASMVNDVSGGRADAAMAGLLVDAGGAGGLVHRG